MWKSAAAAVACVFAAVAAQYENPVWAPDGKSIVFVMKTADSDWNIYRANVDGSDIRQLTRGSAWDPAWAPDAKRIAFVSTVDGKRQILTMSADGLDILPLTNGPAEHFHPAFSPDRTHIALTAVENGASRIVVMDSDGTNGDPVTPLDQRSRWPAWSPDGKRIAYFAQGPVSEIWQVDVDTLERVKLFDSGLSATTLDWSADGKHILLTRQSGKETGIDILNLKTGQARRVESTETVSGQPRWSPDGRSILFATAAGISILDLASSSVRVVLH